MRILRKICFFNHITFSLDFLLNAVSFFHPIALIIFFLSSHFFPVLSHADETKEKFSVEIRYVSDIFGRILLFEETEFFFRSINLICKRVYFQEFQKTYSITVKKGDTEYDDFSLYIYGISVSAGDVSGYVFGRKISTDTLLVNGTNFISENLCFSLCGLECPSSGVFLEKLKIDEKEEKVYFHSPHFLFSGNKISFFFLPQKVDLYGKAPGFLPPEISLSKKHGIIAGIGVFIPLSFFGFTYNPFDFSLSGRFFSKTGIFLGETSLSYSGKNLRADINSSFANKGVFFLSSDISSRFGKYSAFSLSSLLFSRRFVQDIPAQVQIASMPFSYSFSQLNIFFIKGNIFNLSGSHDLRYYSDFLTRYVFMGDFKFSSSFLLDKVGFEISPGAFLIYHNFLQNSGKNRLLPLPFAEATLSYGGNRKFELSSRYMSSNLVDFLRETEFIRSPYRFWTGGKFFKNLKNDFFLSPSYLSLSYEDFFHLSLFPLPFLLSPYISLNLLSDGDFLFLSQPIIVPEAGADFILPSFIISYSFGLLYPTSPNYFFSTPLSNSYILHQSVGGDFILDIINFGVSFSSILRFFLLSGNFQIHNNIGFSELSFYSALYLSNSLSAFSFYREIFESHEKSEAFISFGFSLDFHSVPFISDTKLDFSSFMYYFGRVKPVQVQGIISRRIRRICGEVFLMGVYNLTGKGEPRISFGGKLNI